MWCKSYFVGLLALFPLLLLGSVNCGKQIEFPKDEPFDVRSGVLDSASAVRKVEGALAQVGTVSGSTLVSSTYANTVDSLPTSSTQLIHDEIRIRNNDQPELQWTRVSQEQNESIWTRFKELLGLETGRNGAEERRERGSIRLAAGRYIVSVSDAGVESVREHSDLESSVETIEQLSRHRLLLGRIVLGLDLPFPPSMNNNLRHLGKTACLGVALCDVFEWKSDYYGDRLTYRAYLNSTTGGLIKLTERFLSGEKSDSYLVDEFVAGLEGGQTSP